MVERYEGFYGANMAEIIPRLIKQRAIEASEPIKDMVELFDVKNNGPYSFSSMSVSSYLINH